VSGLPLASSSVAYISPQALEKPTSDDDKSEENAMTIRPTRSPAVTSIPLSQPPAPTIKPIVEDYSDLIDEEDAFMEEKVADFKVRVSHITSHCI
jgi:hypothetical protein